MLSDCFQSIRRGWNCVIPLELDVPHYAESNVPGGAVRRRSRAGGVAVSPAVRFVAQIRTALHYACVSARRPDRIKPRGFHVPGRIEVVRAPLPGVPDGVVETETVWVGSYPPARQW